MPLITSDAFSALRDTVTNKNRQMRNKLREQDFGEGDSMIASTVMNPGQAVNKGIDWLREQINTAGGLPSGPQDEGSMYATGNINPESRAQAGLNLAGMAQAGAMPGAPMSRGGTLGTVVNSGYDRPRMVPDATDIMTARNAGRPIIGTGSTTNVMVGSPAGTPFNGIPMGRNIPFDAPTQNVNMRSMVRGQYRPEGIFNENNPETLSALISKGVKKKSTPVTEFMKANEIAQSNASLPIEQGGLGLPPNNTAMDRAKAMGFDTDTPLYHGTNKDFNSFNPNAGDYSHGASWFSDNPELAGIYAMQSHGKDGSNIIPTFLKKDKYFDLSKNKKDFKRISNDMIEEGDYNSISEIKDNLLSNSQDNKWPSWEMNDNLIPRLKDFGYKGTNAIDANGMDTIGIFDPKNIRSMFAAFDPMKKESANILASILAGTTLANTFRDKKEKK